QRGRTHSCYDGALGRTRDPGDEPAALRPTSLPRGLAGMALWAADVGMSRHDAGRESMDAPIHLIPAEAAVGSGSPATIESRLAAYLMELGKLDERGLQRARRAAASAEGRLVDILAQLGIVSERDLAEAIAAISGLALVPREQFPQDGVLMDRLSARFLRDAVILPLAAD